MTSTRLALCDARGPLTDLIQKLSGERGDVWLERLKKTLRMELLTVLANLSLMKRIARGKYDWVNSDIVEEHFPTSVPADYTAAYKLYHFDRTISSYDAIRAMEQEGFRPATLVELLAFGEANPEVQKQFPIIALGSAWQRPIGDRYVPLLDWGGIGRRLDVRWFELDWGGRYRFLAVSK